jgi:glycosyltransferase involved in cell wall biosynthesis
VVIPAYNSATHLQLCLEALTAGRSVPHEIIVVDDGSTDNTPEVLAGDHLKAMNTGGRRGPAMARNLGAAEATGDVLLFLDSDVCVQPDTLQMVSAAFEADPQLDALMGSYDNEPGSPDFLSQYRNLMHAYVHQTGAQRASTFWSGCGAIRRSVFLEHSGFQEAYGRRPAIEDIELGFRLVLAGRKIILDRTLQVKHLKHWTFWNLAKTDILDRGIPWTELILRDRFMPNDLNLQLSQRVSVALVFVLVGLYGFTALLWRGYFLIPMFAILFGLLARYWSEFGAQDRPRMVGAGLITSFSLIGILAYRHQMFGLIPPLALGLALLLAKHRYGSNGRRLLRWSALVYILGSVLLAVLYLPMNSVVFVGFIILAMLGLLNSQFYIFLAGKRGLPFMLAAIPFHLLYHFYNGISFTVGLLLHLWRSAFGPAVARIVPALTVVWRRVSHARKTAH